MEEIPEAKRPPATGVIEIYLRLSRSEIGLIKAIVESYDCVGVIRTVDRQRGIIVVMVPPDFLQEAREILASVQSELGWEEIPCPNDFGDDWLMNKIHTVNG